MTYHVIKIDNRDYLLRDTELSFEISTEAGWLTQDQFIHYLFSREKLNAIQELAEIGLDRLITGA